MPDGVNTDDASGGQGYPPWTEALRDAWPVPAAHRWQPDRVRLVQVVPLGCGRCGSATTRTRSPSCSAESSRIGSVDAGDEVSWAVDLIGGETALVRAVLTAAGHQVIYVPGRTVETMTGAFAGEAETDARDP
jgi:hypothetical protein